MSTWKSAITVAETGPPPSTTIETTSRFRKTAEKRLSLKKKPFDASSAPNLSAVVNAKPEIKAKAQAEVKKRLDQSGQKIMRHSVRRVPPETHTLKTDQWTNAFSLNKSSQAKGRTSKGKRPSKSTKVGPSEQVKPKSDPRPSFGTDSGSTKESIPENQNWTGGDLSASNFNFIKSPNSGAKRAVIKSPKKKSRKPPAEVAHLAPPLGDDGDSSRQSAAVPVTPEGKESKRDSNVTDAPSRHSAMSCDESHQSSMKEPEPDDKDDRDFAEEWEAESEEVEQSQDISKPIDVPFNESKTDNHSLTNKNRLVLNDVKAHR